MNAFPDLSPDQVDFVVAVTSDGGPWVEDLHYLVLAGDSSFQVPNSMSSELMDWLERFPSLDFENMIRAASCTEPRIFILWNREGPPVLGKRTTADLTARLSTLLERLAGVAASAASAVAAKVIDAYRSPTRAYHGLRHISHCLWELDQIPGEGFDRDATELAIWYHDVVYDSKSKTNEHDSAATLRADLVALGSTFDARQVEAMIMASTHAAASDPVDATTATFLDIDLAILGRNAIEYRAYLEGVRLEYAHVPTLAFQYGRKRLLTKFLQIALYRTPWFLSRYGMAAKENMKAEITEGASRFLPPWQ
jgi:predicted metal-dependent HD superfamily phosphohydrolase